MLRFDHVEGGCGALHAAFPETAREPPRPARRWAADTPPPAAGKASLGLGRIRLGLCSGCDFAVARCFVDPLMLRNAHLACTL